jgi:hypothetical protein
MSTDIKESDWKTFRELHPRALERAFDKAIADIERTLAVKKANSERLWDVAKLVKRRQKGISASFDDFSRSTALSMIARIRYDGFLTDEELSRFSEETQQKVRTLLEISTQP